MTFGSFGSCDMSVWLAMFEILLSSANLLLVENMTHCFTDRPALFAQPLSLRVILTNAIQSLELLSTFRMRSLNNMFGEYMQP